MDLLLLYNFVILCFGYLQNLYSLSYPDFLNVVTRKLSSSQWWLQVFKGSNFHLKAQIFLLASNTVIILKMTGSFDLLYF